jgi:3-phenylpropionate/cinnamic acid dioxygenase small subunit
VEGRVVSEHGEASAVSAEQQIANLCFRYAELVDGAEFDALGEMFAQSTYGTREQSMPGKYVPAAMRATVHLYDDGTPCTKHVMTNLQVYVDDDTHARARSCFTVMQAVPGVLPLQPILTGRYADTFELIDGEWRFTERVVKMEQFGDTTHHMLKPLKEDGTI